MLTTQPVPGVAAAGGVVPGRVLADRYEVRREIARGGMGAVYAAWDRVREEEIAIKVLHPHLFSVPQARVRFLEEAKTTSSLSHPCIVNVYDVQAEGPLVFLTMEMLEGRNLRDEIAYRETERRPFTVEEVLDLARDLCGALSYAHQHLVHRDVKPENVFLCSNGARKLMDFGIARLGEASGLTLTGQVMGTLRYMAPEQHESTKDADHCADQYSLALVFYELLAGELPTPGSAPLHEVRGDVSPLLSAALDRALRPAPDERHANVAAFLAALSEGGPKPARKRPWPIAAAAGVVLIGAAAVLPFLDDQPADPAASKEENGNRGDSGQGNGVRAERVEPREESGDRDPAPPSDGEVTQGTDTEVEGGTGSPTTTAATESDDDESGDDGSVEPEGYDEDGLTPLHLAIRAGNDVLVGELLAAGHS
ncbi:MAG: serine/threonine-protein kinase, partial [Planctomycetota bacterium]|nr:serine/threonine-protein kinase [Planctomycetota bacterium]